MERLKCLQDEQLNEIVEDFYSYTNAGDSVETINELTAEYLECLDNKNVQYEKATQLIYSANKIAEFVSKFKDRYDELIKQQLEEELNEVYEVRVISEDFIKSQGLTAIFNKYSDEVKSKRKNAIA